PFPKVVRNENRRDDVYVNSSDNNDTISLHSERDENFKVNDTVIYDKLKDKTQNFTFNETKNIFHPNNSKNNSENSHKDNSALKNSVTKLGPVISNPRPSKPSSNEDERPKTSFLGYVINTLTQLPVIGNVLRASVDPLYRPIVNQLQADNETIMRGENDMKNWCFGVLGCIKPTYDFFHPLYRPVNLPPYPREQIDTIFYVHSRQDRIGFYVPALYIEDILNSTFNPSRPTKIIIHGYLNNREETWTLEMVRSFLSHGDYNVISVDWSGGSYALYSQATANTRVVALEISRLLDWAVKNLDLDVSTVHIVGHSLGAHTAGYVGEKIRGIGRITGLDPAEPYFQYMPESVRLDPSDANFVDVIHTDIDSFFALTGPRGFGLQQPVGHVDFYPNGGKDQPEYHYILTVNFNDESSSKGSLRGRLKISFVDRRGRQKKFDLTSLSPVKFPRKGTKSFLLEHFEDLSESKEAHIHWTYESDLLDPLTFCVIFCKADLSVSHIHLLNPDK
ncbi:Pancreatic lipase-related protein 2, partial [Armadillidium vulgare]